MSWNEIVEMMLKVVLLILATGATRNVYFTSTLFSDLVARCEATSENATGPRWFFATLCSCPTCLTYWSGVVTALCLWPLAALGGWWVLPSWLLGGLSAGYVVNHFSEDPRKVRTQKTVADTLAARPLTRACFDRKVSYSADAVNSSCEPENGIDRDVRPRQDVRSPAASSGEPENRIVL